MYNRQYLYVNSKNLNSGQFVSARSPVLRHTCVCVCPCVSMNVHVCVLVYMCTCVSAQKEPYCMYVYMIYYSATIAIVLFTNVLKV